MTDFILRHHLDIATCIAPDKRVVQFNICFCRKTCKYGLSTCICISTFLSEIPSDLICLSASLFVLCLEES